LALKFCQLVIKFLAIKYIIDLLIINNNYDAKAFLIKKKIKN